MVNLRAFKTRMIVEISQMRAELLAKYPDRRDRIEYIVDILLSKTYNLRAFTIPDYLFTITLAAKEFPEFWRLVPSRDEVDKLMSEED